MSCEVDAGKVLAMMSFELIWASLKLQCPTIGGRFASPHSVAGRLVFPFVR